MQSERCAPLSKGSSTSESTVRAIASNAIARLTRGVEFIADGEIDEAVHVLLDLERELQAALQKEAA
jgi:hypothetical protein